MGKRKVVSNRTQKVVAEVLTRFMWCQDLEDVWHEWDKIFEDYKLWRDIFTGCPCSAEDYFKGQAEYEKQIMIDKYGHCDGL